MESNKRKTETELEQEETKKVRMSEKEMDLEEWIRGCESLNPEIPFQNPFREMTYKQTSFYENLPDVLEKDTLLFANICPLHVAHKIAKHWIPVFDELDHSSEQRMLFFVLNDYIKKNDERRRSLILIRLMEIAKYYSTKNTKYKLPCSLVSVPNFAKTVLAVMDHSNLNLVQPNTNSFGGFRNQSLTDKYGFDTIVQQSLFPERKIVTDPTLLLSTECAKNKSTKRYNDFLVDRYEDPETLYTYLKPLVLKIDRKECNSDKVIYIIKDI